MSTDKPVATEAAWIIQAVKVARSAAKRPSTMDAQLSDKLSTNATVASV
jgi:hypothetical protein